MYRASKIPGPGQYRPEAVEGGYTGLKDGFGEGLSNAVRFGERPASPDMPMMWANKAVPEPVPKETLQETHHSLMKRLSSAKVSASSGDAEIAGAVRIAEPPSPSPCRERARRAYRRRVGSPVHFSSPQICE